MFEVGVLYARSARRKAFLNAIVVSDGSEREKPNEDRQRHQQFSAHNDRAHPRPAKRSFCSVSNIRAPMVEGKFAATPIGGVASAMTVLRDIARCPAHVSSTRAYDPAESPV